MWLGIYCGVCYFIVFVAITCDLIYLHISTGHLDMDDIEIGGLIVEFIISPILVPLVIAYAIIMFMSSGYVLSMKFLANIIIKVKNDIINYIQKEVN